MEIWLLFNSVPAINLNSGKGWHTVICLQFSNPDVKPQRLFSKIHHYNAQHITQNDIWKFPRHKNTYAWSKNLYTGKSYTQNVFLHSTALVFDRFPCICALDGQVCCLRHLAYDTTLYKLLTRPFSFHSALRPTFLNTKTSSVWTAHKGKSLACNFMSCASDITKISTTVLILICCAVYNTETYFFRQHLKDSIYFRQHLKMQYKHKRLKTALILGH